MGDDLLNQQLQQVDEAHRHHRRSSSGGCSTSSSLVHAASSLVASGGCPANAHQQLAASSQQQQHAGAAPPQQPTQQRQTDAVESSASYSSTCSSTLGCGGGVVGITVTSGSTISITGRSVISASTSYSLAGAASSCSTSSAWSSGGAAAADDDGESYSTCGTSNSGCAWILARFGGREVLADYEFGLPLGRGTFGVTRLVTERVSARPFACKTVCKERINSRQYIEDMRCEVQILQHLVGVPGVVQMRGAYEDCRAVNLVLELCTGGDLLDHILRLGRLPEADAAAAARAIVLALQRCHARGVLHRDVKPENFLLATAGCAASCRVSDFGVSAFFQPGQKFREVVGTPYYMAPEVLLRCYDQSADIWSAGVVLYLMLSGQLPFMGATDRQVCAAVLRGSVCTEGGAWDSVSEGAKSVVRRMLCRDPKQRATAEELLAHPWMARECVVVAVAAAQAPAAAPLASAGAGAAAGGFGKGRSAPAQQQQQQGADGGASACSVAAVPTLVGLSRSLCAASPTLPPLPRAAELRSISATAAITGCDAAAAAAAARGARTNAAAGANAHAHAAEHTAAAGAGAASQVIPSRLSRQ